MHFSSAFATTIALLPLAANAWNYSINKAPIHNGENDVACTAQAGKAGSQLSYSVGWTESCVLHVYSDGNCATQVGISSKDWETTLTQDIAAFSITDC